MVNGTKIVLELERSLLHGGSVDRNALAAIPPALVQSSPLLSHVRGEQLLQLGKLREASHYISTAVKGLAAQGLQRYLLEAMANLVMLYLRTGNLVEVRTILLFLQEEEHRNAGDSVGLVLHALAKGTHIVKWNGEQSGYIHNALEAFKQEGNPNAYALLILDLVFGLVAPEELVNWEPHCAWLEQQVKLGTLPEVYLHIIRGMRYYHQSEWERAIAHLEHIDESVVGFFYYTFARAMLFRARCRSRTFDRPMLDYEWQDVLRLLAQCDEDMELQFIAEIIKFDWFMTTSDVARATEARQRALVLYQMTEFPYQARMLKTLDSGTNRMTSVSMQPLEVHQQRTWRVYCFSHLKFVRADTNEEIIRFHWKRKKTEELFIYLLLQARFEALRDRVTEILFGEYGDSNKGNNHLYVIVHELRKVLYDQLGIQNGIFMKEGKIRLLEHMIEYVDVEQFMTLTRVGEQLWSQDRELALDMFEQAIHMYDELLANVYDFEWLNTYREFLLEKQVEMLKRLAKHALAQDDFELAEDYVEQWLRIRPLQEDAHYERIHLLVLQGRKKEAIVAYYRWEELCLAELGSVPMAETKALITGIEK